jgi:hypothetical protein
MGREGGATAGPGAEWGTYSRDVASLTVFASREEPMPPVTRYQLWQHAKSRELWAVRLEFDTLTGVFGPLEAPARSVDLSGLLYEDHPDDFEWLFRAADDFTVVRESA